MKNRSPIITPIEIESLLKQAADKALDVPHTVSSVLNQFLDRNNVSIDEIEEIEETSITNTTVYDNYILLCKLTAPITGKSIIDSRHYKNTFNKVQACCLLFLVLTLMNLIIGYHIDNEPSVTDETKDYISFTFEYVLSPLAPFLWGGLGSCIFLLKKFADISSDKTFDYDFYGGWATRLLLGVVLGGIIPYLFDIELKESSKIDDYTVAFLIGLSVKVVYGALEKTVEELALKLNLNSSKKKDTSNTSPFSDVEVANLKASLFTESKREKY